MTSGSLDSTISVPKLNCSSSLVVYDLLHEIYDPEKLKSHESFYTLLLNEAMEVYKVKCLACTSGTEFEINPKEFGMFLHLEKPDSIIISHNHPSELCIPSFEDLDFTTIIKEICEVVEVVLDDHLIYSASDYFSFKESGLLDKLNMSLV